MKKKRQASAVVVPEVSAEAVPPPMKKRRKEAHSEGLEEAVKKSPAKPLEQTDAPEVKVKRKKNKGAAATDNAVDTTPEKGVDVAPDKDKVKGKSGKRLKQARKRAEAQKAVEEEVAEEASDPKVAKAGCSEDDRTVFISGLPYTWELDKLRGLFSKCGEVQDVRAPTWQDSGRLRGYAHITFSTQAARDEAIQMDGIKVGSKGRYLKIEAAKAAGGEAKPTVDPKDVIGKKRLFVKNLPYDATEVEIKEIFGTFGTIVDVRVPTSFGRSKGFAYIEFAKAHALAKAVEAGAELRGRRLFLDADSGRGPRAGFHYRATAYEQEGVKAGGGKGRGRGGKGGGRGAGRGPTL